MVRRFWIGVSLFALASSGCGGLVAAVGGSGTGTGEHVELAESVSSYTTDALPNGVIGGPGAERLAADISAALAERGSTAVPDGALAGAATWVLREVNEGHSSIGLSAADAAARRYGFAGVPLSIAGFALDENSEAQWRKALAFVPPNIPINRYGISVARSGRSAAIVFGAVEMQAKPLARHAEVNGKATLSGEIAARYSSAHVYLTKPDGNVTETRIASRKIETTIGFPTAGKYKIEVMGDGPTGPVVVFNVPIFVGIAEPDPEGSSGGVTVPADAEVRMFELLNQGRKAAGLYALQADDELRAIALGHSTDMVDHHFFGHVSPTTGTPEDRYKRSGIVVAAFGENVAESDTAENSYDGLMGSPGHRANMLSPQFTHVGIAAAETEEHQLAITLFFARRANLSALPRTAAQVEAKILAMRAKRGVSAPALDAIYRVASDAGVAAYVAASNPTSDIATSARDAALKAEVRRTKSSRPANCSLLAEIVELSQLEQTPILLDPNIRSLGVGARLRDDEHGKRLAVMISFDGAACH